MELRSGKRTFAKPKEGKKRNQDVIIRYTVELLPINIEQVQLICKFSPKYKINFRVSVNIV